MMRTHDLIAPNSKIAYESNYAVHVCTVRLTFSIRPSLLPPPALQRLSQREPFAHMLQLPSLLRAPASQTILCNQPSSRPESSHNELCLLLFPLQKRLSMQPLLPLSSGPQARPLQPFQQLTFPIPLGRPLRPLFPSTGLSLPELLLRRPPGRMQ